MRVWVLGTGSGGNAVLLESEGSRVLIDAGFPPRTLGARLAAAGVPPESVEAVVLTHEHADHARGATAAAQRWGWTVLATSGTVAGLRELRAAPLATFASGDVVEVGAFSLRTVRVPHDATEPIAIVATARTSGARAAIAYDLGHATPTVRNALVELDVLVLEANHDEGMLRAGPYPPSVRHRIAGANGHLSNRAAAELASGCAGRQLAHVVLAHLSDTCNDPRLATRALRDALRRTPFGGALHAAPQHVVVGPFTPRLRRTGGEQLALGL